jgi:hypothetical protein
MTFLLWLIVLFFCWPLALLALVLYPLVWLFLLPFRIVGIAVDGVLELVAAIIFLPARVLGGGPRRYHGEYRRYDGRYHHPDERRYY